MSVLKKIRSEKPIPFSRKIIRIIASALVFIMVAIIFITDKGLDVLYITHTAMQSLLASNEIEDALSDTTFNFFSLMDSIEREYELTVELYTENGDFVYSSSYKGEMSEPTYSKTSKTLPDSFRRDYAVIQDLWLGSGGSNAFNLCRDTMAQKPTEYLVGTWQTESGVTIKTFRVKSNVDASAKLAVVFVSFVTIIVSIFSFLAISVLIRRETKPLSEMSRITKNMSALDFSQKCEAGNVTEIAVLAESINEMSDSLEKSLDDLRQKNEKLQNDIEQEKTIDKLRQVFISGVSHEMKTPIAIIQGYSEGLKVFLKSDPETAEKYCDTIIDETERMNSLVMKLLDIIKYESGEYNLIYENFCIHDVVASWYDRNSEIFREKGITAINDIDKNFIGFGDPFILESVVNNYLSNALSHVENEMVIKASAQEIDSDRYRISIFNTGTPIAPKDIDQIWNSFYRADKAMSRAQGRFGLGLAIVAAIQKLHNQDYGVINHDDGVEFWFDIKKSINNGGSL